ncbi:hypothetical protein [Anabaena lutea]|uniref:hypothetical protein n=1 Tax=Anabaena lutea TaxID=212350 RepID=UPI001F554D62|nr:hypothetical protein [Anabaena lutea]
MLAIKRVLNQISRTISLFMLAGLIWLMGLPMLSVHADGFYSEKTHKIEMTKPFYSIKQRRIAINEPFKPYYSTQERHKQKVYITPTTEEDYIESRKGAGEVIPKNLGTGSR